MTIKDFPVRVKKRGKTRGRPSKEEVLASKLMSEIVSTTEYCAEFNRFFSELMVYGNSTFDASKIKLWGK